MKAMQSSCYSLYFVAEMRKGALVLDADIKDAMLFDHCIGERLFAYQRPEVLIIQRLTPTYALEYHVACGRDLRDIQRCRVLEHRQRQPSRESRKITQENEDYNSTERNNIIVSFNEVKEAQWRPQDSFVVREGDMPNPEELLIPSPCDDCGSGCNHIRLCRFSHDANFEVCFFRSKFPTRII